MPASNQNITSFASLKSVEQSYTDLQKSVSSSTHRKPPLFDVADLQGLNNLEELNERNNLPLVIE
jgi:hypothetical protein